MFTTQTAQPAARPAFNPNWDASNAAIITEFKAPKIAPMTEERPRILEARRRRANRRANR